VKLIVSVVKSDEYILKRYRGCPPSLILHLHPTHFRFDQQEGSFSYKSPMRILIEHLKLRTIPHDLVEFFYESNIPFYEGCMIVQVYDHKSTASSQASNQVNAGPGRAVPFSIHNYNQHLTPSPWVPFPFDSLENGDNEELVKPKSSEQKDKENMPAPSFPNDGQRSKSGALAKKPNISTIVLHPTIVTKNADLIIKAADGRSGVVDGRGDSRQDTNGGGPLSATVPPTPSTAVPSTPQTSMAPPAKRQKKSKTDLEGSNFHVLESQITFAITAPLSLDPVSSAAESAALLADLAHPMHSEKPPSPKTRKRTVAEMAADEALAVSQERYMLCLDERLSSSTTGAQGGANPADGDGQAGGAAFEPRFERFKTLENIKVKIEETKKAEKVRLAEVDRRATQDKERERLKAESEKRETDKMRQQAMQQDATRRQQEAHRRGMAAASQQPQSNLAGLPPQVQPPHAHPPPNNIMPNGIQAQPQRFHQQHVSQAQNSSPIIRNGTPQSNSSPTVNNMGNIPMQHSTSSMGGSPARPGSVVQQNHSQIGGPTGHVMTAQRSQQSHAGTPRMTSATPNIQSTPLNRPMSQTPRMSQASPLQGQMAQAPQVPQIMMNNGQQMGLNPAQQDYLRQQQLQQQQIQQRQLMQQRMAQQHAAQNLGNINGQMNPQLMLAQQQMMAARQAQAQAQAHQMNNPIAQNYQSQMAAMAQRGALPQNMNFNVPGTQGMSLQQMQQIQQMQQFQNAQAAQAQAQAQLQQHPQQINPQTQRDMVMRQSINKLATQLYQNAIPGLQANYPNGIPEEVSMTVKRECQRNATLQLNQMQAQRMQAARQMMAQQNGMQTNGMQNGMGMQRPQGM
jgi:transcription factor SPT20